MKPYWHILACFSLALFLSGTGTVSGQGRNIPPQSNRDQVLQMARNLLHPKDTGLLERLSEIPYPFDFYRPPIEEQPTSVGVKPKEVEVVYSDEEVLEAVAPTIRPTGTVIRGNQRILVLPNGNLSEGALLNVNFRGKPYEIRLEQIRNDRYVLRLNETTLIRYFDGDTTGRITRTPSPDQ